MSDKGYNGWSNYETWNCALWIDNMQRDYQYWQDRAQEVLQEQIDANESNPKEVATGILVQELDVWIEENKPAVTGMYADILSASLSAINYHEIVEHWLADIDIPE